VPVSPRAQAGQERSLGRAAAWTFVRHFHLEIDRSDGRPNAANECAAKDGVIYLASKVFRVGAVSQGSFSFLREPVPMNRECRFLSRLLAVTCLTTALVAGCSIAPVSVAQKSAWPANISPPDGEDLYKVGDNALFDQFAATWVSSPKNDEQTFVRGLRLYGDIRDEYFLRTSSGITADKARAEVMPKLRQRIANAARLSGHYYLPFGPIEGAIGEDARFEFRTSQNEIAFRARIIALGRYVAIPRQFSATKFQQIYKIDNLDIINAVQFVAIQPTEVTGPLTPQTLFELRKASSTGKVFAQLPGGYLNLGNFSCTDQNTSGGGPRNILTCTFSVTSQAAAPVKVFGPSAVAVRPATGQAF
jgi:hypothetical protein